MARRWPDHFEIERLKKQNDVIRQVRSIEGFYHYFKPTHKVSTIAHVLGRNYTWSFFGQTEILIKNIDRSIPEVESALYEFETKLRRFIQLFISLCDANPGHVNAEQLETLQKGLELMTQMGVSYYVPKSLTHRLLISKLART